MYDNALWLNMAALAITGAGLGGAMTAASAAIILNSPENSSGTAASIEGVAFEFGGAIGITLFGGLLSAMYSYDMSAILTCPLRRRTALIAQSSLHNHWRLQKGAFCCSWQKWPLSVGLLQ